MTHNKSVVIVQEPTSSVVIAKTVQDTNVTQNITATTTITQKGKTLNVYEGVAPNAGGDHNHDGLYYRKGVVDTKIDQARDKHFSQNFTAQDYLEITHNLGKQPSVTVLDSTGSEVIGHVNHVNQNSLSVAFSAIFTGKVILN